MIQLDTKTVYSFMDSVMTIEKYVARAKALGYQRLGIMDVGNLYGAYHFLEACQGAGVQALLGLDLTVMKEEIALNLRVLATTTQGYRQLLKLATKQMTGELTWEGIQENLVELVLIIPYFDGVDSLELGQTFYIGVDQETPPQTFVHPCLPLPTVRYFEAVDVETLHVLHAIRDHIPLKEVPLLSSSQSLQPAQAMQAYFEQAFPGSMTRLENLTQQVHYELDQALKLPRFNVARPAVEELRERALKGLAQRGVTTQPYLDRLDEELAVIHQMGFDDYFLIVWDLLRFGRRQGYYMGMGRGSAAGSLVAYALKITGIDPVANGLLFERFLNLERYSMPDIDIDMPDVYRGEFLRYVRERYGSQHVAQIVTFSTFGAKQAIRDVFKRFGVPEYELTHLTKKISFKDTLTSAYEGNASFRQFIQSKLEYQKAFRIAKVIEGQPRQTSIHAAGVVMSDQDLTETIPLKAGEEMLVTQYDAHSVEANGLLKMDFLGLRNLTFLQRMQEAVADKYGQTIEIEAIDLEDQATLALFAAGKTKGIFQFEQAGAIALLKRVQPACFEEVAATTSLNRPGASDYADNFVRRKQGREAVDLIDPSIADILAPTYGIMLYQEQVMQIAQVYAGFTLGKADLLRRAMGKKNPEEMHKLQADFVQGAQALGHDEAGAVALFSRMEKFAGYGFNRSHAYAYSALAFQLAYFKAHYPDVFFDIMLNYSSGAYITDALHFGFRLAPLSINAIPYRDKLDQDKIFMGFKNIKGLPKDLAYWIIEHRPFQSVEDFILKLPANYQKTAILTPLVQLGLFDTFHPNRREILENLENLFTFAEAFSSLFAENDFSWTPTRDWTEMEKYELERQLIGVGLSPHPLQQIAQTSSVSFTPLADLVANITATILVQIQDCRVIRTKKTGEQMAFLKVSDGQISLDVTVFPETYQKLGQSLTQDKFLFMTGKTQEREGRLQLTLSTILTVSAEKYWIQLADASQDRQIARILSAFAGEYPVVIRYEDSKTTVFAKEFQVRKSAELDEKLKKITMKTIFR